jgi:phosphatidylserine/phosphatidylglycerophosphate/cardiolipin synthase-like enzyme
MTTNATFATTNLAFYFHSKRASVDGKALSQLVKFIESAKHSLDVAIYDMRNTDVLKALKRMSSKINLHILYDTGKAGGNSTTVDPKVSTTAQAINAAGLKAFAQPVNEKSGHLMHNKFIVRDGISVWSGSGNFTNGGLLCRTTISSQWIRLLLRLLMLKRSVTFARPVTPLATKPVLPVPQPK